MATEFSGTDPNVVAEPAATVTEIEIRSLQARLAALETKKLEEDAVKAGATEFDRKLAVRLHTRLCPSEHANLTCPWFAVANANDPNLADWTEEQHKRWIAIAVIGKQLLAELQAEEAAAATTV